MSPPRVRSGFARGSPGRAQRTVRDSEFGLGRFCSSNFAFPLLSQFIDVHSLQRVPTTMINGSSIQIQCAGNPNSLRSAALNFVVLDEFGFMRSSCGRRMEPWCERSICWRICRMTLNSLGARRIHRRNARGCKWSPAICWTQTSAFTSGRRDRRRFCADSGLSVLEKQSFRS